MAPIGFVVVRGELSVELPAGSAPSAAPALKLARIPVTAKIVLDPAVLDGGAVLDAWGPLAHDVPFGDNGERLTKGFIGVRLHEVPGGGGELHVEGQLSGVLAGAAGIGDATFLQVGFRLAHGGGGADNNGDRAVAVRHARQVLFEHEEEVAGGAARVALLGPAPADECKAHGQLVRGTLAVRAGFGGGGVVPFTTDVSGVRHCAPDAPALFVLEAGTYTQSLLSSLEQFVITRYPLDIRHSWRHSWQHRWQVATQLATQLASGNTAGNTDGNTAGASSSSTCALNTSKTLSLVELLLEIVSVRP